MTGKVFGRLLPCFLLFFFSLSAFDSLYLTIPTAPETSMAVHWLEEGEVKTTKILYRAVSSKSRNEVVALQERWGNDTLCKGVLKDLLPDTEYFFSLEGEEIEYRFRTMPSGLQRPVYIAIGGDAYQKLDPYEEMNKVVAEKCPDFVVLGGDIAYANRGDPIKRWKDFLRVWHRTMVTPEGRIIPLVCTPGNHEILSKSKGGGRLFLQLFPYLEQGSYGVVDFKDEALFLLLDTGHINPIAGKQTDWIKQVLEVKKQYPYKFAVYHISAYPSVYSYGNKTSTLIRKNWCPLFEEGGVLAAFENHNHAFKRTYPMKQEKIDPRGVVYIGDGTWAVEPRKTKSRFYLEEVKSSNCFSLMTLDRTGVSVRTFDLEGKLIDTWNTEAKRLGVGKID